MVEAAGDDVDPRAKSLALADAGERACDGASVAELGRALVQGAREEESLGVRDPAPARVGVDDRPVLLDPPRPGGRAVHGL